MYHPPVIPPREIGTNTMHSWKISVDSSPISVQSFAPRPRQTHPYKPSLRPHSPLPKTLANRRQAARARSRHAATIHREHCRFAVSSGLLLIPILHLLFFISLAHLPDTLSFPILLQDVKTDDDQISLPPDANSGEKSPGPWTSSSSQNSPLGSPRQPNSPGKIAISFLPL
jgi:hypothetical protein